MTEFRQHLAPLSEEAWSLIRTQARETLAQQLAGRRVVDVKGPYGLQFHAVGTGRLKACDVEGADGAQVGVREVVPVMEVRKSFSLELSEFDALARGAEDINLDPLVQTAKDLAALEDSVLIKGFAASQIQGMIQASPLSPVTLGDEPKAFIESVATGVGRLRNETVSGGQSDKFHLLIGPELRKYISSHYIGSHSLQQELLKLIGGKIYTSESLTDAVLVNTGSGNYELSLAQDFTIGYEQHDARQVTLFLMEAFTFRVLNPEASLLLKSQRSN